MPHLCILTKREVLSGQVLRVRLSNQHVIQLLPLLPLIFLSLILVCWRLPVQWSQVTVLNSTLIHIYKREALLLEVHSAPYHRLHYMRHIKAPSSIIQQICCVIFLQDGRSGPGGHIDFIKNMKLRLQKWFVWLLSIIGLITMTGRGRKPQRDS